MKLIDLAGQLHCELRTVAPGDGELDIRGVMGLEKAGVGQITFLANAKYAGQVKSTKASAIIVHKSSGPLPIPALLSDNPYLDFARALALFYQTPRPVPGVHPSAVIASTALLGANASIAPGCVIGEGVVIGRNAVLHPMVVIYEGAQIGDEFTAHAGAVVREHCRIGDRVILQNGVVVGGDGFGFAKRADGTHEKIVQSGPVVIEDDVEIQTLSSVDRATVGETRIRRGAKIDSLVQIGHACEVGEDNIICAQVGLAGSTVLQKNVLLAGQVGVAGHLTIHENAIAYSQSGIPNDVLPGSVVAGYPAVDAAVWRKYAAVLPRLPELVKTIRQLEKRVAELEGKKESENE